MNLTKAQELALDSIINHITTTPDRVGGYTPFSPPCDWHSPSVKKVWYANRVYGKFNTATLKALEKKGLIKIHEIGGRHYADEIEILKDDEFDKKLAFDQAAFAFHSQGA